MYHDVEKMVVAERPHEVELDEVTFSEKMSVKELQMACKERQLAHTGSKKKLLERLVTFKVNLENQMHLAVANKLYNEQRRRPVTLGQPKLPSLAEQEFAQCDPLAIRFMVPSLCSKSVKRRQA